MVKKITKEVRIAETYRINSFRTNISEESIIVEHGQINDTEVRVVSSVAIPPQLIGEYLGKIVIAAVKYQDKYGIDLGFSKELIEEKKESGE